MTVSVSVTETLTDDTIYGSVGQALSTVSSTQALHAAATPAATTGTVTITACCITNTRDISYELELSSELPKAREPPQSPWAYLMRSAHCHSPLQIPHCLCSSVVLLCAIIHKKVRQG